MSKFLKPHTRFRNDWGPDPYPALALQNCPEALIALRAAGYRILKPEFIQRIKHMADFVMLFCQTPTCSNFCELEELAATGATFTCCDCNNTAQRRIRISPPRVQQHQFDKHLGGYGPGLGIHTPGAWSTKRELRKFLDSNDSMLADGHQIKKQRQVAHDCPDWVLDRFEFLNFLVTVFPKMLEPSNKKYREQHRKAALWAGVLYYYYRMGLSAKQVATLLSVEFVREMPNETTVIVGKRTVTPAQVDRIVVAIKRRKEGLRVDGKPLGSRRGRPKSIRPEEIEKLVEVLDSEGVT